MAALASFCASAGSDAMSFAAVLRPRLHGAADGLLLHTRQKPLHDAELDVGFEQAQAHLAQCGLDVLLVQLGEPGEAVLCLAEAFDQRIEHVGPAS